VKPEQTAEQKPAWNRDAELTKMLDRIDRDIEAKYGIPDAKCFLTPTEGRIIVAQDVPVSPSKIIKIPKQHLARPTTGRVVAAATGLEHWLGKRVVYGMMSGTALQFKNRPAWIVLQEAEIVATIDAEDAEIEQDQPLPLGDEQYA
jgi:co-chaperonin GroES (HSP10)